MEKKKKVLVVGAGGFVGGFAVEEGLRRGYEVYAGVRQTTSRAYLTDPRIRFAVLDFGSADALAASLRASLPDGGRWDYIIYNLGATKAMRFADFSRINYDYLRLFLDTIKREQMVPDKLLFMSSLSVMGLGDEKGYTPYRLSMVPHPCTRYGTSKLKAETELQMSGVPYIIFRATGIYGPRDHDYFLMFKSIAKGFDFSVGYRKQLLSFIYVEDLARAMYDALEKAPAGKTYLIAEQRPYSQREFRKFSVEALGKRHALGVRFPLCLTRLVCAVSEKIGVAQGKPSTLNSDKYKILRQRNWCVDTSEARQDFGFNPVVSLPEGIEAAVKWYREQGWL